MKLIDKVKTIYKSAKSNLSDFIAKLSIKDQLDLGNKHKNLISIISLLTIFVFVLSITGVVIGFNSVISKNKSSLKYIEEDGIRYIEIADGYIKEKLTVETGTILPELKAYFRDDYNLPDDLSVQYFEDNNALSLDDFTYEEYGDKILKGLRSIDVVIFGEYTYETKLEVVDTLTPDVTLKDVTINQGDTLDLNSFVNTYVDNSTLEEYNVAFKDEVDYSEPGTYEINIYVCDTSENCFKGTAKLTVLKVESPSGSSKPNGNGGSTKPNGGGSTTPNGNGSTTPNSGGSSKPKPNNDKPTDTSYSFDTKNVIKPEQKTCTEKVEEGWNDTFTYSHYGTLEITPFTHMKYKINSDCSYTILELQKNGPVQVKYAFTKFNGTAKTMLNEAIAKYETKNKPSSGYQTTLDTVLKYTNDERKKAGLNTLTMDYHLSIVATMRAMELAYSGIDYSTHTRPNGEPWFTLWVEYGLSQPSKRAENIAFNTPNDKLAVQAFMASTTHKANILDKLYKKIGIGKFSYNGQTYLVQMFST